MTSTVRTAAIALTLGIALHAAAQPQTPPPQQQQQQQQQDFSPAEKLLFMSNQLAGIKPPQTLSYAFRKTGSLEPGFDDRVTLALKADADGRCCAAHTEFLGATRRVDLPDLPSADGNPVLLHFLERELREMQRLTKGSQSYFRKRIRLAVYQAATVTPVELRFRGRVVQGQEVAIRPYLDDPNRARFENLAQKEYRFVLSPAVPGGLVAIRTRVPGGAATPPLLAEELTIDGAELASNPSETR